MILWLASEQALLVALDVPHCRINLQCKLLCSLHSYFVAVAVFLFLSFLRLVLPRIPSFVDTKHPYIYLRI